MPSNNFSQISVRRLFVCQLFIYLTLGVCAAAAVAQTSVQLVSSTESSTVPSRVVERVDDTKLTRLVGNTHPLARAEFDMGMVNPQMPLERMTLVLKRSAEQEAALKTFMAEQVDPRSANFHHWLNSKEFGARFGVSESDILSVTSWLQNHGFRVDDVSNGRIFIHFSGSAGMVKEAFHTEIHHLNVHGAQHIANVTDPSIPEALSPVVVGIESLHDFFATPAHVSGGEMRRNSKTGKWTQVDASGNPKPSLTIGTGTGNTPFEEVTPYDFATIYNVVPLWTAGIDGTGVSIAIAGRSDISLADVKTFRTAFGLPTNLTQNTPIIIVNGADPGIPSAPDKEENTLDVEWSGGVAKGAQIKFVTTASTATSDGAAASVQYIIDSNPTIASIMSFSYQSCELFEGAAGNTFENNLWQQGAAEGITEFVASGDYAAAQCDGGQNAPYEAKDGLFVSGLASTPYDVAVGGTDLNWANNPNTTYWSATNSTANGSSALGYIPEVPWNTTCASDAIDQFIGATSIGLDEEQTCQYLITHSVDESLVNAVGGSGGKSSCIAPTGTTVASCAANGGYPKPSWQTGSGVPTANARYVPDVSLFASSNGMYSGYLICDTDAGPCDFTNGNDALAQSVGGTSVASPAMAGIMALVLQKTGSAQGLANPVFYQLAAKDNRASCNSVSVAAGNACNFYDITTDNIAVPCSPGTPDCTVHHTGDTVGIMTGNTSTTGFDLATGLGSVNANNLVTNWVSTSGTAAVTLTPTSLTFASTAVGSTSAGKLITVKSTGTAPVSITNIAISGGNFGDFSGSGTSTNCSTTTALAPGSSCTVTIAFAPAAAGARSSTLVVTDNAGTGSQSASLSGTGTSTGSTVTLSPASATFTSTAVGSVNASRPVFTLTNNGATTLTGVTVSVTGTDASSFSTVTACSSSLAASASCATSVTFSPQSAGSLSATLTLTDSAGTQTATLSGTGTATTALTLSPTSLAFATTAVGSTTAAQVVTVLNSGTTAVTLTSESITGTNATSFVKSATTCGTSLASGASCTISVAFKPTASGPLSAALSLADNVAGSPQTVSLSGTGGSGTLTVSLSPTTINFGSLAVNTVSAAQTVTVKNTGTSAVSLTSETITGTNLTSFKITANTCGSTLAASATCAVSVDFAPASVGGKAASLSVADNATGSPQTVALSGTSVTGGLTVTLTPTNGLNYAATAVGATSAALVATVKNTGTAAVTLSSETVTGTNATSFVISANTCTASLAASASCTISVQFKPLVQGSLQATLSVADNATGSPQTIGMTGEATAPTGTTVTLSPTSISFPATIVGNTSDAQVVTLTNSGSASTTINAIAIGGTNSTSFVQLNNCGSTLAASASCSIYVAFKPSSAAAKTGTLSVADSATGSPQTVALSGTGTAAPSVTLSKTSIAFPATTHGTTSAAQAVTLTNAGTATLTLTSITLTGTNPTDFQMLDTCGATLAAGANCTVYLAFSPAAAGSFTASLSVADNGAASPQKVALTGTGN